MDVPSLQELVQELRALRIREAEIVEQLEATLSDTPIARVPDSPPSPVETPTLGLKVGDRIRIKNRVNKPANWANSREWIERENKTATIRDIIQISQSNIQVHFITDGGIETWRAPGNVTKLD